MTDNELEMLRDLLDLEDGLSEWELEFVESLSNRPTGYELTDKQAEKLEQLHDRHI